MLDAQLVVLVDEDLGEERLVAQAPVGVVAAGVDAASHLVEFSDDPILLTLEHGERDRVGVVRLHEAWTACRFSDTPKHLVSGHLT
ncbi:hypothetical protein [Acidipropionibacterium thoenii]|uniref:hypothetical protein n=1 Tax=Acidipropionibacterium thoenii TaxID=1751 RepID=UPI000487D7E3|nr:hypothetical protein [Acidipropionibacterium thoenii]